jgi:hypothetical protein
MAANSIVRASSLVLAASAWALRPRCLSGCRVSLGRRRAPAGAGRLPKGGHKGRPYNELDSNLRTRGDALIHPPLTAGTIEISASGGMGVASPPV